MVLRGVVLLVVSLLSGLAANEFVLQSADRSEGRPTNCAAPTGLWKVFEQCQGQDENLFPVAAAAATMGAIALGLTRSWMPSRSSTLSSRARHIRTGYLLGLVGILAAAGSPLALFTGPHRWAVGLLIAGLMLASAGGAWLGHLYEAPPLSAMATFVFIFTSVFMWGLFFDLPR